MKKVLFLYSKTGGGHLRIAQAIAKSVKELDPKLQISFADGLKESGYDPEQVYLLSIGKLEIPIDLGYKIVNSKIGAYLARLLIRKKFGQNLKKIINNENPDLIVAVHSFISPSVISDFQAGSIPFFQVVVNLSLNRFEADGLSNKIFVPTLEWLEFAKKFIQQDKLVLSGFPINEKFIPSKHKPSNHILVMGGGSGVGDIKDVVLTLSQNFKDKKITVVCGINENIKKELERESLPHLTPLGFVNNVNELIKQADIVITKAGAVSLMEAATIGRPIIITSWKGGWEKYNIEFIEKNNLGFYCPEVSRLPDTILKIYSNYQNYIHPEEIIQNASKTIALHIIRSLQ